MSLSSTRVSGTLFGKARTPSSFQHRGI
uniref:Uncharacterized protein n=1 Tax=Anguilla anguilla TaxID=7936 RepID=A0A0E9TKC3_ANGAN